MAHETVTLAAYVAGLAYDDIPAEVREKLEFVWLESVDQAIATALEPAVSAPASAPD